MEKQRVTTLDEYMESQSTFMDAIGKEKGVTTYEENIVDLVTLCFGRLEAFAELMKSSNEDTVSELGYLAEEVFAHQKNKIVEALNCIEDVTGQVELIRSKEGRGDILKEGIFDIIFQSCSAPSFKKPESYNKRGLSIK